MIYADDALKQLRECFDINNIEYILGDMNQRVVNVIAKGGDISITVWFDVDKQVYGFNMVNGGCKTYSSIKEFEDYFITYMLIYTNFIPKTKLVANQYDEDFSSQTIFDTFLGNKKTGYISLFRILGENNRQLRVSLDNGNVYSANYVELESGSNRYRVLGNYQYKIQDGVATLLPSLDLYVDRILKLIEGNDNVNVKRIGKSTFEYNIDTLHIVADIDVGDVICYRVKTIDNLELDSLLEPNNPYDIMELYNFCIGYKESIEEQLKAQEEETSESVDENVEQSDEDEKESSEIIEKEEESEVVEEESSDFEGESVIEEETTSNDFDEDEEIEEIETEVNEADETSEDGKETNEGSTLEEVTEEVEEIEASAEEDEDPESEDEEKNEEAREVNHFSSLELKVAKGDDNNIVSVHFVTDKDIYLMSVEKAISLGLPVHRIKQEVEICETGFFPMTSDEKRLHTFVKDISSDDELCSELFNALFE